VMGVIEILSSRREYTKINPFVVLLGKGNHEITSTLEDEDSDEDSDEDETTLEITRSNITFVGNGKDTTTIFGGLYIVNHENITFKNMTVTNTSDLGHGIEMSNAKVELYDVSLNGCAWHALSVVSSTSESTLVATRCEFANSDIGANVEGSLTSATFKNCVFNDNSCDGIQGWNKATIHLHGEATAIHSNGEDGMCAFSSGKVIIHLPSNHNTSYNNGDGDRRTVGGGTITNVEDQEDSKKSKT